MLFIGVKLFRMFCYCCCGRRCGCNALTESCCLCIRTCSGCITVQLMSGSLTMTRCACLYIRFPVLYTTLWIVIYCLLFAPVMKTNIFTPVELFFHIFLLFYFNLFEWTKRMKFKCVFIRSNLNIFFQWNWIQTNILFNEKSVQFGKIWTADKLNGEIVYDFDNFVQFSFSCTETNANTFQISIEIFFSL